MNKILKKALEMDQFNNQLPELEIGDVVELGDVWDGNGEIPEGSYSYHLTDCGEDGESDYAVDIDYKFSVIEEKEDELKTIVKITDISLI